MSSAPLIAISVCLVQNGAMNTKLIPPTPASKSVRLTIPVSREVHNVFQRLAAAVSISTGRAMGDWLADTLEAAQLMASTMERARSAPKIVTAELHAMMLGMTDETKALMDKFSKMGTASRNAAAKRPAPAAAPIPPSSNTGGKGTTRAIKTIARNPMPSKGNSVKRGVEAKGGKVL